MSPAAPHSRGPFRGPCAPVRDEVTLFDLQVSGALPAALRGRYVRTGPNPLPDSPEPHAWLGAPGMLHGIELDGGQAGWYRNRWVRTPDVSAWQGEPPLSFPPCLVPEGQGNSALFLHAGELHALSGMSLPYRISPKLETLAVTDFGGLPAGSITHPRPDPVTGELHTLAHHFEAPYLRHHVIDARGQLLDTRVIDLPRPVLVQDFALTPRYLVILDLPVVFSEEAMLEGAPMPFLWEPEHGARIGLLERSGRDPGVQWFDIPPCWISHIGSAWEDGRALVFDAIRHERLCEAGSTRGPEEGAGELIRCTLDPVRGVALPELLDRRGQDFPVLDPRSAGRRPRHLWTTARDVTTDGVPVPAGRRLFHYDLEQDRSEEVELPDGDLIGEVSFVAGGAAEGDGWLLGFVYNERSDRGAFVCMATGEPHREGLREVARIELPRRVPLGLHGCWQAQT